MAMRRMCRFMLTGHTSAFIRKSNRVFTTPELCRYLGAGKPPAFGRHSGVVKTRLLLRMNADVCPVSMNRHMRRIAIG